MVDGWGNDQQTAYLDDMRGLYNQLQGVPRYQTDAKYRERVDSPLPYAIGAQIFNQTGDAKRYKRYLTGEEVDINGKKLQLAPGALPDADAIFSYVGNYDFIRDGEGAKSMRDRHSGTMDALAKEGWLTPEQAEENKGLIAKHYRSQAEIDAEGAPFARSPKQGAEAPPATRLFGQPAGMKPLNWTANPFGGALLGGGKPLGAGGWSGADVFGTKANNAFLDGLIGKSMSK